MVSGNSLGTYYLDVNFYFITFSISILKIHKSIHSSNRLLSFFDLLLSRLLTNLPNPGSNLSKLQVGFVTIFITLHQAHKKQLRKIYDELYELTIRFIQEFKQFLQIFFVLDELTVPVIMLWENTVVKVCFTTLIHLFYHIFQSLLYMVRFQVLKRNY